MILIKKMKIIPELLISKKEKNKLIKVKIIK